MMCSTTLVSSKIRPIDPNEGASPAVDASNDPRVIFEARAQYWYDRATDLAADLGTHKAELNEVRAENAALREALTGHEDPIPQRSLDDIWNAILDVKDELKAINAELSKSDAARENDRLRTKLLNEGKVK